MSYPVDMQIEFLAEFRNRVDVLTNPTTVTLTITEPDGTATVIPQASLTNDSTGVWSYLWTAAEPVGLWTYRFDGTGAVICNETRKFRIR